MDEQILHLAIQWVPLKKWHLNFFKVHDKDELPGLIFLRVLRFMNPQTSFEYVPRLVFWTRSDSKVWVHYCV